MIKQIRIRAYVYPPPPQGGGERPIKLAYSSHLYVFYQISFIHQASALPFPPSPPPPLPCTYLFKVERYVGKIKVIKKNFVTLYTDDGLQL